jgi:hypothetical protein
MLLDQRRAGGKNRREGQKQAPDDRCDAVHGRLVNTPCGDFPAFAPRTRKPPTRTLMSGAVSVSNCAPDPSAVAAHRR